MFYKRNVTILLWFLVTFFLFLTPIVANITSVQAEDSQKDDGFTEFSAKPLDDDALGGGIFSSDGPPLDFLDRYVLLNPNPDNCIVMAMKNADKISKTFNIHPVDALKTYSVKEYLRNDCNINIDSINWKITKFVDENKKIPYIYRGVFDVLNPRSNDTIRKQVVVYLFTFETGKVPFEQIGYPNRDEKLKLACITYLGTKDSNELTNGFETKSLTYMENFWDQLPEEKLNIFTRKYSEELIR